MRGSRASAWRLALVAAIGAGLLAAAPSPASAALTATAQPPGAATEGAALNATVASFTDGAILGLGCSAPAQYAATVAWGDGTTSAGTVTGGIGQLIGGCLYAVNGAHTYAEEGTVDYSVSIAGPAASGATGPTPLTVHDAPLTATASGLTATQGTQAAATVATFTDANPAAQATDFQAMVAWGDNTTAAGSVAANPRGGFAVTASHTYIHSGSYSVSVTIRDAGGSLASAAASATVVATAAPGGPTPPATTPPAPLRLGLSTPVLARGGTVVVGVRCPAAAKLCRGRLNVATVAAPHSKIAGLRRAQTLGTTLFIIPGGRRADLSVRPKRVLVAELRRAGSVVVAAYASSFDAATGRSQVASLTAKLSLRG
jgi:hypothetical protein